MKKKDKPNTPKDVELIKQKIEKTSYYFLKGLYDNRKQIFNNILYLFIIPILIFLFGQLLCYGKIIFESGRMLFNFLLIYITIAFFYCITGKLKPSLVLSTFLIYIIGLINYFITTFRGTPLVPWDIFSVNVALTVLPTFKITLTKELIGSFILLLVSILILFLGKAKDIRNKKVNRSIRITSLILIVIFFFNFYNTDLINCFDLDHNWDPKEEYHNNGLLASLFKQSKNLFIKLPEGYSIEALKDIISETELSINEHIETITENTTKNKDDEKIDNTIIENTISSELLDNTIQNIVTNEVTTVIETDENKEEEKTLPHIITIMNESLADLTVIDNFNMTEDPLPYIHSLNENTIKGNVHVSVFGATTPNTEWEFLTSNSMAFVPYRTVPYQQYITRKSYSLATLLKEQGYSTYAMHSYYPQGYNRNIVYPLIGFDKFLHMNNMENIQFIREYPDDKSTYDNIISIFENKKENEKIFNFTLTMQNHGSYTDETFINTIIAENGEYQKLNQYLTLIKESDNAFKYLLDYFKDYPEPVIILMFGDHQPYLEDEFYDKLLSRFEDPESKKAKEMKYITPYIIWANYDYDYTSYNIPDISINYLSSLLLDVAEVDKSLYHEFLDNLREFVPVITGNGYTDTENNYYNYTDTTPYTNLIKQYNYLQYNNMFDKNNKLVELFTVNKK